uniref:ARAD1D24354p n=1 Tax=Blastobotrys adeninivorans TaxID=409370 RepID=A0A060TGL4_BLAAD
MFTNTMPLAAMFMRNKLLAWVALFTALQSFLNEPFTQQSDAQPTWTSLVTALVGLVTCYMDFVIPPKPKVPTQPVA